RLMSLPRNKMLLSCFSGVLKSVRLWEGMPQKRILIVEDNSDLRRMFKTALSLAGFDVDEAGDGLEALRVVEERRPDLVVLDLVLRALDGLSVQQELAARAATANIPIVIVTGSTIDPDNHDEALVLANTA